MKNLFLLPVAFIAFLCSAQQKELDSLLNELKKHPQEDTVRLNLLNEISHAYQYTNADKGLKVGFMASAFAEKSKNFSQLGKAYYNIACNYNTLGDDSISLIYCNKSLNIRKQLKDSTGIAIVYHLMGIIYYDFSEYNKSIQYQQRALKILISMHDKKYFGDMYNSLGVVYDHMGDYPTALNYLQRALNNYEQNDNEDAAYALANIGQVYTDIGNYPKALTYYNKALEKYKQSGNRLSICNEYGKIANLYDLQGDTVNARVFYRKQFLLAKEISYDYGLMASQLNLGISYTNTGNYDSALTYFSSTWEKLKHSNDKTNISITLNYLAYCYINASISVLKKHKINTADKFNKALQFAMQSIKYSLADKNLYELKEGYENLSDIYAAQKDYAKALQAYKQSIVYKDSMLNDDTKQQITRLEMQYSFAKTQDSIKAITDTQQALAKAEIQKQHIIQNSIMAGAGFLILASFGGFVFYKRSKDIKTQRNEAELKSHITDTEMKALRAQMNPHFIFNSLNSIADYIDKHQTKAAADFTTKFAKLMRMVLENSEHKEIPLTADLKALELYMQLERFRLNNKFDYTIKVDENIDAENTLVPPLILQPFIENSIWHGIVKKAGNGNITIVIKKEHDMICCIVEDDGIGISETKIADNESKSLGMRITKDRIDVLNKLKNSNASINVFNKEKGVIAEVKLPLELSF